MTFVTIDNKRNRLEALTCLLLSAFPGSVIYQQTNLLRVTQNIRETNIDAIFLQTNEMNGAELRRIMRRWRSESPVFLLAEQEDFTCSMVEGDVCCLTRPITEENLREVLFRYGKKQRNQGFLSTVCESG